MAADKEEGRSFGDALVEIAEGGLLRLIASEPVQQAIGRLVLGAVDVPVAKLEQWAQGIRSDTAAGKQITAALAAKAKALAITDGGLIDRGLERWTRQIGSKQRARERVAARTLEVLAEDGLPPNATAPSEDFMGTLEDIAEKASSDSLVDLIARILAGEIRHPKRISRRTLQIAGILDAEIVGAITLVRPYVSRAGLLVPPNKQAGVPHAIALLTDASILSEPGMRTLNWQGLETTIEVYGERAIIFHKRDGIKFDGFLDGVNLTPPGSALLSVFPKTREVPIEEIASIFLEYPTLYSRMQIGSITPDGAFVDETTLRDFPAS